MRIIFAGTPDFAASHLQALLDAKHSIIAVYTQPDRPAGRGKKVASSAVKTLALAHNLPVFQPASLKTQEAHEALRALNADLMVVVAYGLILPAEILNAPVHGCINVHGSILPKWRGAAPIQRALWAGDKETGVTIMQMDEGLDTGNMLSIHTIDIANEDTSATLYDKLASLGPKALVESLAKFTQLSAIKQDDTRASYAAKLSKAEAHLDWQLPAQQLERNIRAFNPWPVAWFTHHGKSIKVFQAHVREVEDGIHLPFTPGKVISFDRHGLQIATGKDVIVITKLQLAGKKAQELADIVNGQASLFCADEILTATAPDSDQ